MVQEALAGAWINCKRTEGCQQMSSAAPGSRRRVAARSSGRADPSVEALGIEATGHDAARRIAIDDVQCVLRGSSERNSILIGWGDIGHVANFYRRLIEILRAVEPIAEFRDGRGA